MNFPVTINNCPEYTKTCKYIVARIYKNELWFYGGFDQKFNAEKAVNELGEMSIIIANNID